MSDKFAAVKAILDGIQGSDEREHAALLVQINDLRATLREIGRLSDNGTDHTMKLININARQALDRNYD